MPSARSPTGIINLIPGSLALALRFFNYCAPAWREGANLPAGCEPKRLMARPICVEPHQFCHIVSRAKCHRRLGVAEIWTICAPLQLPSDARAHQSACAVWCTSFHVCVGAFYHCALPRKSIRNTRTQNMDAPQTEEKLI
jgi:hypothetical protein